MTKQRDIWLKKEFSQTIPPQVITTQALSVVVVFLSHGSQPVPFKSCLRIDHNLFSLAWRDETPSDL